MWGRARSRPPEALASLLALGIQFCAVVTVLVAIAAWVILNPPPDVETVPDAEPTAPAEIAP